MPRARCLCKLYFKFKIIFSLLVTPLFFISVGSHGQGNVDSLDKMVDGESGISKVVLLNKLSESLIISDPEKSKVFALNALEISHTENFVEGKVKALYNLGEYYLNDGSYKTALNIFKDALRMSESQNNERQVGISYGKLGAVYFFLSQFDKSLEHQLKAASIYKRIGEKKEFGNTLSSIGYIYSYKGSYKKALNFFDTALKVRESLNISDEVAKSYNSIGDFYSIQGDISKALENYKESYRISILNGNKKGTAISMTNIGIILAKNGSYKISLDTLFKALEIKKILKNKRELALSYEGIGFAYHTGKNYNQALNYFFKAISINKSLNNSYLRSNLFNKIANTYSDIKEFNLSLYYHKLALQSALESTSQPQILASYESMAQTYLKKNDALNFFNYYKKYTALKDSLTTIEKNNQLAEIQAKFETEQNNKKIEIYKQEKKRQDEKLKEQQKFIYLLLLTSVLGIILLGLVFSFYKLKKKSNERLKGQNEIIKKQYEELEVINNELRELNEKLVLSEGELRKSNQTKDKFFSIISHDLRGPLNSFTSFLSLILNHTTTFNHEQILDIIAHTEKSLKNLSTLLNNLLQWSQSQMGYIKYQPVILSLEEAVMNTIKLFGSEAANKNITLFSIVDPGLYVKSDRNMLDFILRNLISNAIKFTPLNGHIAISGVQQEGYIEVSVKDNGIGIDKEKITKIFDHNLAFTTPGTANEKGTGLGLVLCKEFAEKNGGRIWVENNQDMGAIFTFTLPLEFKTQLA